MAQKNNPWYSLPKDHSFTAYCEYTTHFNSVCTCIQYSKYAYKFVRTRVIILCCVFVLCLSVRVPLSPDRGLPLSPNSVLHVQPQISTKRHLIFIVGLIWSP